jgi:hypothetical protein
MDLTRIFNFASETLLSDNEIIVAIISGVLALAGVIFKSTHESKLKYITNERKAWRDKLRDIMYQIYKTKGIGKTKCLLTELYTRLNSYGYDNKEDILHDGHIWALIKIMERTHSDSIMNKCKKKLRMYISLLLKYDWERAKREVEIKSFSLISKGFYVIAFSFIMFTLYMDFGNSKLGEIIIIGLSLFAIYIIPSILVKFNKTKIGKIKAVDFWYPLFMVISTAMFIDFLFKFNYSKICVSLILFSIALVFDYVACRTDNKIEKKYVEQVQNFQRKCVIKNVKISKKK